MKILFVPYGTEQAPATRYRVMQYLPHLKSRGIDFAVFSAISRFSTSLMIKSPDFLPLPRFVYYVYVFMERLVRFFYILVISPYFDAIFLQRSTFPMRLEALLRMMNKNIIFDIDDAIYMPDEKKSDVITRIKEYIKKSEVINILRISKAVVVENEHIKNFVSRYCKNVRKIPGPIDTERFVSREKSSSKDVVIGWIGSPATTPYLSMLSNVFETIKKKHGSVRFKFIGLGNYFNESIDLEKVDWSYETEVRNLQDFDIGIMPMPDNEWTKGKLGCKMLQYMAVGIPSVVSFTSTNAEIIKDGQNGFSAASEEEWVVKLSKLVESDTLRKTVGLEGRKTIYENCSVEVNVSKFVALLREIAKK